MTKITKSAIAQRLFNSYCNGLSKAMDGNNSIRIFHKPSTDTIHSAWKDVGIELTYAMKKYEKTEQRA